MAGSLPPPPPPPGPPTGYGPPPQGWGPPQGGYPPQAGYPLQGYPPQGWAYVAPTFATNVGRVYANFGERLGALILDVLILSLAAIPLVLLGVAFVAPGWETYETTCRDANGFLYRCTQPTDASAARLAVALVVGFVVMLVVWIFYWGHFEGRKGASPGKRVVGLEVLHQYTGARLGFGRAVGRNFARILSSWVCYLGYFWMLWDKDKQTFHDKLVRTRVIKTG